MARTKWVTRTVATTKVKALCFDAVSGESVNITFSLAGDWTDEERVKIDREIRKRADENGEITVKVNGQESKVNYVKYLDLTLVEKLYWMDEQKFIRTADKVTDPREAQD